MRTTIPLLLLLSLSVVLGAAAAHANSLGRDSEPVVLTGALVPGLTGVAPSNIVAFRYDEGWSQVPVQVDERDVVDFGTIYNSDPTGYTVLTYTDTSTFTGPDSDPLFDDDDELVLAAVDAGGQASGPEPGGTLAGSGVEITLTNPLTSAEGYLYLFESDGSLDPAAGVSRVSYDFVLLSGDYKTTYGTLAGPNPEDSVVTTASYSVHFSDRWVRDETAVSEGGATNVDVLDRHRNLFAPGNCGRSEDTFSAGEGAFIVNRTGPIRALRAYVGANSGPTTHRIHEFYEDREEIITVLRVHAISGMVDLFDYSPGATGMIYRNDLNTAGVTIDGVPDAVTPGAIQWEMVTGPQGTLAIGHTFVTDIPDPSYTAYYCDDVTPPEVQCTGDEWEYGASGPWIDHDIPNTDPGAAGYPYHFTATRHVAYGGPSEPVEFAEDWHEAISNPLILDVQAYDASTSVAEIPDGGSDDLRVSLLPSPTRGSLVLRLDVPSGGDVSVAAYDVAGRFVRGLAHRSVEAGRQELRCDLTGLASGTYFIRVVGPSGAVETKSVVLIR